MDAAEKFIDGLDEGDFKTVAVKRATEKVTFPCEICGGAGTITKTYGYSYYTQKTYVNKCTACKGRGSFTTAPNVRKRNRANVAANKVREIEGNREAFDAAQPGLAAWLAEAGSWSGFALSLGSAITQYGDLTEKQLAAALSMRTKCAATTARREAAKADEVTGIDLTAINEAFATAVASGHKRPTYRAESLIISRAPDHGYNAGALYVKDADGTYLGKITAETFAPVANILAAADVTARLQAIAADPKGAAIRYGQRTGSCGCCGRELTRADSIAAGIGPICAANWGF